MEPLSDPAPMYTTENGGQLNIFYLVPEVRTTSLVLACCAPQPVEAPNGFGSELSLGPAGVTALTTLYVPGSNQWQVFFLSPNVAGPGGIHRLVYDSGDEYPEPQPWIVTDTSSNISVSEPAVISTPDGQQHTFFNASGVVPGSAPGIYHVACDPANPENPFGTSTWDLWAPAANPGPPVPMYTPEGNELNIFYNDGAGGIWKVSRDLETTAPPSEPVQWAPLTEEGSPPAASDPAVICISNADVSVQHIFYIDAGGNVWHVYYSVGAANGVPLLDPIGPWGSGAVGNPAILNNSPDGLIHLFYRDAAGSIWHVSCNAYTGAVPSRPEEWFSGYMFPGRGRPPGLRGRLWPNRAAGDPFPIFVPFGENGQQHVFFRGHDDGIYDVFRDGDSRYTVKWA
jgi:hypothetical protein